MWPILKYPLGVWAVLGLVDDLKDFGRLLRLLSALIPGVGSAGGDNLCSLCDTVVNDMLLKGSEGLSELPCNWACLRVPACVRMCEQLKAIGTNSSHFPCIAAGYCFNDGLEDKMGLAGITCRRVPVWRCEPAQLCERHISGLKMTCELKAGIGRWISMSNALTTHAGAIANALYEQPRCNEKRAGPWCIATPRGFGALAEFASFLLSLGYGAMRTVQALSASTIAAQMKKTIYRRCSIDVTGTARWYPD